MSSLPGTVLLVDDDASVRRGLARLLTAMGLRVETFASAEAFLRREPVTGNACLLLDLRMTGLSGLELQAALAAREHHPPIVFLTGHGDVPSSVAAMKRGAVDFLQKPVEEADLERAVRAALALDRRLRRNVEARRAIRARVATLTPREREVLALVIAGELNKRIAARLGIAEKTVKVHRGRVMSKLQVGSVAELVRICARIGLAPPADG